MRNNTEMDILRDEADMLASTILRNIPLAVGYRDALAEAVDDSDFGGKLDNWFRDSGFTTDHPHLTEAFAQAPSRLLAYWDGFYLIRVEDTMAALQIDALGVLLNGVKCSDVDFADGILRFKASPKSPWNAELAFVDLGWHGETSLATASLFQRTCKGRIWDAQAMRPESENATGSTKRIAYGGTPFPSPAPARAPASARIMPAAAMAAGASGSAVDWSPFLDEYGGEYEVHWIETAKEESKTRHLRVLKNDDSGIKVEFLDDHSKPIVLSTAVQHPSADELVFKDNYYNFHLKFDSYGELVRTFKGTISAIGEPIPGANNATGVFAEKEARWPADVVTATALGAAALVLGILIPLLAWFASTRDAKEIMNKLNEMDTRPGPQAVLASDPQARAIELTNFAHDGSTAESQQEAIAFDVELHIKNIQADINTTTASLVQLREDIKDAIKNGDLTRERVLRTTETSSTADITRKEKIRDHKIEIKDNADKQGKESKRITHEIALRGK